MFLGFHSTAVLIASYETYILNFASQSFSEFDRVRIAL